MVFRSSSKTVYSSRAREAIIIKFPVEWRKVFAMHFSFLIVSTRRTRSERVNHHIISALPAINKYLSVG